MAVQGGIQLPDCRQRLLLLLGKAALASQALLRAEQVLPVELLYVPADMAAAAAVVIIQPVPMVQAAAAAGIMAAAAAIAQVMLINMAAAAAVQDIIIPYSHILQLPIL